MILINLVPKQVRTGIIYLATSPSGKQYVGQTGVPLEVRKTQHQRASTRFDSKFSRAIRKYGTQGMLWETVYENVPLDELNQLEIDTIARLDTFRSGYNSTPGGEGVKEHTEEARQKLSKAHKGKKVPDEVRARISASLKLRPSPGEETRKKLSEATILAWAEGRRVGVSWIDNKERVARSSAAMKNRKITWADKISKTRIETGAAAGSNNPMFGRNHSDETKVKMSESKKGKYSGSKNPRAKLNPSKVQEIRELYALGVSTVVLAKQFSVSKATIWRVISRTNWGEV